jgi:diguanylate cyclase (GGDEF)-like protein/PAS domain S-box-containing protein
MRATPPVNEAQRLAVLRSYRVLDSSAEPEFDRLVRLAAAVCEAPIATLTLIDEHRQWFKARVGLDLSETHRDLAICAHAILQRELLVVTDASADPRFADNELVTGPPHLRFYAGVPLVAEGGYALGTLAVMDCVPRGLSAAQRQALITIAEHTLEQLDLHRQLLAQREQTASAEQALSDTDDHLQLAVRAAHVGLWDWDLRTDQVYRSPEWKAQLGYREHEVSTAGDEWYGRLHPDDRERAIAAVRAHIASADTGYRRLEFRLRHKDGGYRWIEASSSLLLDDDRRPVRMLGAHVDITDRKRAEQALIEGEMLRRIAGRLARLGGWAVNIGADRVHWSDEVCAIHEMPPGTSPSFAEGLRFYAPEWRERIREVLDACMRDGTPFDEEMQIVTAKGRRVWVRTVGEAVRDASGRVIRIQGAFQDTTEKKRAEQEARQLAARLTTTLESITDAFYTLDRRWRFTYLNGEAERLLERRRDDLLDTVIWDAFPAVIGTSIELEYRRALRENHALSFEEFYTPVQRWFEIRVYPSTEGLAVYFRDVTERKRAEDEIQYLALYDSLTGLPNRRLLRDRVQHAFVASARHHQQGALMFIDLDDFKALNDTLGHQEGDRLLQQVASRLSACLRDEDTVARFGGDEFVVVLTELHERREEAACQAEAIAEKIRLALNRPYRLTEQQRHVSSSIGIALFSGQDETVDDVMKRADLALYRAKAAGRNTLRLFDPDMQAAIHARVALEGELRDALLGSEFVPYYQPQYDSDWRLTGAEALVRWRHPLRALVKPAEFVPLAEETGLILDLGRAMLAAACEQLAVWAKRPDTARLCMSVNISAREFRHPEFVNRVLAALEASGADPERLRLELTETVLLDDIEDIIRKMTLLRDRGVSFSLDDFGTGYSSLYYLKRLPLDQLKIDQRFVRDVLTDASDAAIVRSVVGLAQNLGLTAVAEGVETLEVRDFLAAHGCCAYQGYLFGGPLAIAEFETLIGRDRQPVGR